MRQKIVIKNLLQKVTFKRCLLQSASGITKRDRCYYKVSQALQSVALITK